MASQKSSKSPGAEQTGSPNLSPNIWCIIKPKESNKKRTRTVEHQAKMVQHSSPLSRRLQTLKEEGMLHNNKHDPPIQNELLTSTPDVFYCLYSIDKFDL